MNATRIKAWGLDALHTLPVLFVGLFQTSDGGLLRPWWGATIDLLVYRSAGQAVLHGQPLYGAAAGLPFIYPPFAALGSVLLAFGSVALVQQAWGVMNALLTVAMVRRLGYRGWVASLLAVAFMALSKPFVDTFGLGQVNVVVTALVVLDLCPGRRWLPFRRLLPQGVLTGIAAGIKLTPAAFVVLLFVAGKRKAAAVSAATFAATVALGLAARPHDALTYWRDLAGGNTGINIGLPYGENQSFVAVYNRLVGHYLDRIPLGVLPVLALILVAGIAAGALWYRAGEHTLGVVLCGLASLYASPIAWNHHFVWVLPLALTLLADRHLPRSVRYVGLALAVWISWSPASVYPHDHGKEFQWGSVQQLVGAGSLILGCTFIAVALIEAWRRRRAVAASAAEPAA